MVVLKVWRLWLWRSEAAVRMEKIMTRLFSRFLADENAATAIEYGMIAALITVAIIAGVKASGTKLSSAFNKIQGNL
jgi:pilus assembly protein Flp/PilA